MWYWKNYHGKSKSLISQFQEVLLVRRLNGIQTDILLESGNSFKKWKCHLSLLAKPWNYNTKRNNMQENSKSLWNSEYLWSWARTISHYQTTNLLKMWFLFLISTKGQTRDKSKFVTKFVGNVVPIIFIQTCLSSCL